MHEVVAAVQRLLAITDGKGDVAVLGAVNLFRIDALQELKGLGDQRLEVIE